MNGPDQIRLDVGRGVVCDSYPALFEGPTLLFFQKIKPPAPLHGTAVAQTTPPDPPFARPIFLRKSVNFLDSMVDIHATRRYNGYIQTNERKRETNEEL